MSATLTELETRALAWTDAHPNKVYASGYDDVISNEMANMLLKGEFDAFSEAAAEAIEDYVSSDAFWADWESDFASAFGFESWREVPEELQEFLRENRAHDETPWLEDAIRHWRGHVTATILMPGAPEHENLIFAPGSWTDADGAMSDEDRKLARFLIETFDPEIPAGDGSPEERLRGTLELVYGGYDREALLIGGKVDLFAIWKSGKGPQAVEIGPGDAGNLLFFEHFNGCGNMGELKPGKTVTMPATFMVDGSKGYGVDRCYGFTGQWWSHEIKVAELPAPEAAPAAANEDEPDDFMDFAL